MELKMQNFSLQIKCSFSEINCAFQKNAKLIFQSVYPKLVLEFEGTIWTVSKKGRGPDPLDPFPRCAPSMKIGKICIHCILK